MDWSQDIAIAELDDEPGLSEELEQVITRLETSTKGAKKGEVPHLVLNFGNVTYLNSSNLSQLLRIRSLLDGRGKSMKLCSVSEEVLSAFTVTGLDRIFRFAPDPMTALAGLQLETGMDHG